MQLKKSLNIRDLPKGIQDWSMTREKNDKNYDDESLKHFHVFAMMTKDWKATFPEYYKIYTNYNQKEKRLTDNNKMSAILIDQDGLLGEENVLCSFVIW